MQAPWGEPRWGAAAAPPPHYRRRRRAAAAAPLLPRPSPLPPRPSGRAAHVDRSALNTPLGRFGWFPWAPPPPAEAKHPAVSLRTLQTLTTAPLGVCWAAPPTFQPPPSSGQQAAQSPPGTMRAQATRPPHAAPTSGVRLCAPLSAWHQVCPGHPATANHPRTHPGVRFMCASHRATPIRLYAPTNPVGECPREPC